MAKPEQLGKLHLLEETEQRIAKCLEFAGQALNELSKDKPSGKNAESLTSQFVKSLESIENDLSSQINYLTTVSTGQPHEGSCYAAQKDLQMAQHRQEHVKSRLNELDRLRIEHRQQEQQVFTNNVPDRRTASMATQRSLTFNDNRTPL